MPLLLNIKMPLARIVAVGIRPMSWILTTFLGISNYLASTAAGPLHGGPLPLFEKWQNVI